MRISCANLRSWKKCSLHTPELLTVLNEGYFIVRHFREIVSGVSKVGGRETSFKNFKTPEKSW